jgi:hypothetical protein
VRGSHHIQGWIRSGRRLLACCLLLLLTGDPVLASPFHHLPLLLAQRGNSGDGGISMDQAVAQARRQNGGKVLSAETIRVDGRKVYRIKILTQDGRVKRTQIDARSGRTVSRE